MNVLLLTLALGAPVEIGKKDDKAEKAELVKLQGIWKLTERQTAANRFPPAKGTAAADRYTLVVGGESYVLSTHAGIIKFDPAKKTVDMTVTEGRYKGTTVPGVYELSGDTLKIALHPPSAARAAGDRPKDLTPGGEAAHTLYTFEKDPKATKDDAAAQLKELKSGLVPAAADRAFGPAPRAAADQATQEILRKVMEKLEAIDKRLDAIEKRLPPAEKK